MLEIGDHLKQTMRETVAIGKNCGYRIDGEVAIKLTENILSLVGTLHIVEVQVEDEVKCHYYILDYQPKQNHAICD